MYTILVSDDHSLITTKKEKIMQRSQGVNSLLFLIKPNLNGLDINSCTVVFEYCTPKSKEYDNRILVPDGVYEGEYLTFTIPFDLSLTTEWGELEVQLSFIYVDLDADGNSIQKVKKTSVAKINILQNSAWSNMMPDSRFTALDQRIIKLDSQIKTILEVNESKADNMVYDVEENSLQLTSGNEKIGDKVVLKSSAESLEDGIPVVDFSLGAPVGPEEDSDNVVEF